MSRLGLPTMRIPWLMLPRHSLRARLMAWNMVILALLMGVLGVVTHTLVRSMMLASVDRELLQRTRPFVGPPPGAGGQPLGPGPLGGLPPGARLPLGLGPPQGPAPGVGIPDMPPPFGQMPPGGGPMGRPPLGGRPGLSPLPDGFPGKSGGTQPNSVRGGRALARAGPQGRASQPPLPQNALRQMPLPPPPPEGGAPQAPQGGARQGEGKAEPMGPDGLPPPRERPHPILVIDLQGRVLNVAQPEAPLDREGFRRAANGEMAFTTITRDGRPARILSRPLPPRGRPRAVVQAIYPLAEVNRALAGLGRALLALVPLALLCAALGGALLTRRVLQPVHRMAYAAGRIGAGDLSLRLPEVGKDEFGELAVTFNGMLNRLETAFREKEHVVEQLQQFIEQQRRFTGDASHELRTPLAVIKANTSLCLQGRPGPEEYRQSVEDIDRAATAMTRLVLDLLLLARSDSGQLGRNPIVISVREVLERAAAQVAHREGAPVRLRVPDDDLCVMGNEEELVRLFSNLLENALRYTPADGMVTLAARRNGDEIQAAVADTGAGIAPEHLPHLGERFYRVDPSRSRPDGGTGLGLSICKSIVEAHGGHIGFQSTVGIGTTVQIVLPAADGVEAPAGREGPTAPTRT